MKRNANFKLPLLGFAILLLSGCDDSEWVGASNFESSISCQTTLATLENLIDLSQLKIIADTPITVETQGDTFETTTILMVRKRNTAYHFIFENGPLKVVNKQSFKKLGLGPGFRITKSVDPLLRCS